MNILILPLFKIVTYLGVKHPVTLVNIRYFLRFGKLPDFKNPKDINQKILSLKLFSDTTLWSELADKYNVRRYVENKGFPDILVPLYGKYENFEQIILEILPNKFVIKSNNGAGDGSLILVKDKSKTDFTLIKSKTESWLKIIPGATAAELHYYKIKPLLLAEKYLENIDKSSLIDYKIWCFHGKPFVFLTCSDRSNHSLGLRLYDLEWNDISENLVFSKKYFKGKDIPKPKNLTYMLQVAQSLSESFPEVRIDLYEINGKVFFGEMTFTSLGGMMNYFTTDFLNLLGSQFEI